MIIALVGLGMVFAADCGAADNVSQNDNVSFTTGDNIVIDKVSVVDENISADVSVGDENISDVPVKDENISADVPAVDENNSTDVIGHDDVIDNETPVDDVVKDENDHGPKINNPKDLDVGIFLKINMMYMSGYSTIEIGKEFNMSADEVQSAVDELCVVPITNEKADYVYKAYGTKTIAQMADELGTGTTKLISYLRHLKNGTFGGVYQIIIHNRDLHLLSENKTQFIIGDI